MRMSRLLKSTSGRRLMLQWYAPPGTKSFPSSGENSIFSLLHLACASPNIGWYNTMSPAISWRSSSDSIAKGQRERDGFFLELPPSSLRTASGSIEPMVFPVRREGSEGCLTRGNPVLGVRTDIFLVAFCTFLRYSADVECSRLADGSRRDGPQ